MSDEDKVQHGRWGGMATGLVVVVVGVLFLADNLGLHLPFRGLHNWWALFILIPVVALLAEAGARGPGGPCRAASAAERGRAATGSEFLPAGAGLDRVVAALRHLRRPVGDAGLTQARGGALAQRAESARPFRAGAGKRSKPAA